MFSTTASSIKRKLLSIVIFSTIGCIAVPASAAVTHIVENGILMGADNVDVDGTKYDVRFVDGLYSDLFPATHLFLFDETSATSASRSLLNTVFLDLSIGNFMSRPDLTNGCYLPHACWMDTPLSRRDVLGVDTLRVIGTVNSIHPAFLDFYIYDLVRHDVLDYRAFDAMTWAVWSPSTVAAIPEPSTYAMMLAGFGLMGFMIRRRKTNEQA